MCVGLEDTLGLGNVEFSCGPGTSAALPATGH